MKMFVWDRVDNATDNYHDQGGIVAIADTLERAREIVVEITKQEKCGVLTAEPDVVRECEGPEYVTVHPDAGCC